MIKKDTFENVVFAVGRRELVMLVSGPEPLYALMDGDLFDDNAAPTTLTTLFPKEAGVYLCDIEYWFEQGYFEGWKADGESEWDFRPVNIRQLAFKVKES